MPTVSKGEKRLAEAKAVHVMRLATREAEETYVNPGKSAGGCKVGAARPGKFSPGRRRRIAKDGATARRGT